MLLKVFAVLPPPPLHPTRQQPLFEPSPLRPFRPVSTNPGSLLYTRTSDGFFHPHQPSTVAHSNPIYTSQSSNIYSSTSKIPSSFNESIHAAAPSAPSAPSIIRPQPESPAAVDDEWNLWPDGEFEADFTWEEFDCTKQLQVHWSCRVGGGDRKGSDMADRWEAGKKSTRTCQGIITCDVDTCSVILRPQTTAQGIASQLLQRCRCNGKLSHYSCGVKSTLHKWSGGVHYSNLGESVADISSVYLNADRVRKERDKVKKGNTQGGDGFISDFAAFTETHPDFVIYSQIGTVTVICLQTPFMASQLLKLEPITTGPVNGLASPLRFPDDAAHGWWLVRTSLLMITSVYCPELHCWVPGIFSYTNGATAAHYECHFYALVQSIAHQADLRSVEVTDQLFAGIADFSEAERTGFRAAFIRFWIVRPNNTRTRAQLEQAFEAIYRGCTQHFRAGVTRIKKISGVVPPEQAAAFEFRVLALLNAADSAQFQARADSLTQSCCLQVNARWIQKYGIQSQTVQTRRRRCIGSYIVQPDVFMH
ncbi:hypothetical protein K438DRAFT_1563239 [Mycena galopus ATCC 62051]|nr:hypothetical protein K438DRAFT_1563239 [Mycena galopus ATCC 62051]